MSLQTKEAFPTLAAGTKRPIASSTPFVWAKLVNGEKKDLAQAQADELAKAQADEKIKEKAAELARIVREEQQCRESIMRAAEFNKVHAARIAEEAARQKALNEKYTRENGWWPEDLNYPAEDYSYSNVPHRVNEKSLEFVQLWLTNFPELVKITTVGDLQTAFNAAYIPWLLLKYERSVYAFETWEELKYPLAERSNPAVRYAHLQAWVSFEEQEYNTSTSRGGPWLLYPIWIAAKHITWENCVFAMSKISGTFTNGLLEINGHYSKPNSQIKWVVSLEPYIATRFNRKPESVTKQQRYRQEARDDEYEY